MKTGKGERSSNHFPAFIEYFILFAIVLVVIQTLLEDLSLILHWSHCTHTRLLWAAFVFDALFSLEFTGRTIVSAVRRDFRRYFLYERGWIDLLTSFPLLLLVSGPSLASIYFGDHEGGLSMGFLMIMKTAKTVRVTRILRLIRIIKIFGKIQNSESPMTNRHVATISTIAVTTLVLVLVCVQILPFMRFGNHEEYLERRTAELVPLFRGEGSPTKEWLTTYLKERSPDVIYVKRTVGDTSEEFYRSDVADELHWTAFYKDGHPLEIAAGDYRIALSYRDAEAEHARLNLFLLLCILGIVGSMMILYTAIFARSVSDPIFVMNRGMRDWDYNLEVKLDETHEGEEVYLLARIYNQRWLPMKSQILRRRREQAIEKSSITMKDVF